MANEIESGPIDVDVAARHAQTLGDKPRVVALVAEDLDDTQHAVIRALHSSIGAITPPELSEYFGVTVKHPALFERQMALGTLLFAGAIPARERELAVLRIAWLCRAPYEWGEHVEISKRYGVTADEIERTTRGSSAPGWTEHEAAILRAVEELLGDQSVSDATWNTLATNWSEVQLLEFPLLVGAYVTTALQQNMLRIRLTANNPGLTHR